MGQAPYFTKICEEKRGNQRYPTKGTHLIERVDPEIQHAEKDSKT